MGGAPSPPRTASLPAHSLAPRAQPRPRPHRASASTSSAAQGFSGSSLALLWRFSVYCLSGVCLFSVCSLSVVWLLSIYSLAFVCLLSVYSMSILWLLCVSSLALLCLFFVSCVSILWLLCVSCLALLWLLSLRAAYTPPTAPATQKYRPCSVSEGARRRDSAGAHQRTPTVGALLLSPVDTKASPGARPHAGSFWGVQVYLRKSPR